MKRTDRGVGELRFLAALLTLASLVCWGYFASALTDIDLGEDAGSDIGTSVGVLLAAGVVTIVLAAAVLVIAELRALAPPRGPQA